MKNIPSDISSRRKFLAGVTSVAIAGLAGCSGDGENGNGGGTSEQSDTGTPTEEPSDAEGGNDPTATEGEGTETGTSGSDQDNGVSDLQEEDESEAEEEVEYDMFEADAPIYPNDAWIEMENPSEQIPQENYDFSEFPNLQIFEEIDIYSDENEAVYLVWLEDEDERIVLGAGKVADYDNREASGNKTTDGSQAYTDQSADIERILGEVVEGVDDVSENISEEYAEILRNS
jgi:hypothetical protein